MNPCARLAVLIVGAILCGAQIRAQPATQGYSAAELYNLGNSFARAGKPGMAVLNYERASLLAPNDPDIQANLRVVRESSHQPVKSRSGLERLAMMMRPQSVAWLGILGILITGVGLLTGQLVSRFRWVRRIGMVAGIGLIGLTVCHGVLLWPTLHAGVIITAAAPVRVSPVPMGDSLFVLPEAETVMIKAEHEEFVLIETGAGRTGWVSRANLASVVPRR
jgi:hypothetical protein